MNVARIAVLAVALIAGGVAAVLVSGGTPVQTVVVQTAPSVAEVLVAANPVAMGTIVKPEDLVWRAWPEQSAGSFISKKDNPGAIEDVTGSIARQPVAAGEPINLQKLVKADGSGVVSAILPAGMRAVATTISTETGAGGFILPNDRVDVLLTQKLDNGPTESRAILKDVRVLGIDQILSEENGQKSVVGTTATLELLPHQTEVISNARQQGTISLALRSLADSNPKGSAVPQDGLPNDDKSNRTSIIRFGVETN